MRIAMVHDYFTQLGGAEKVADELYQMLPHASLHTLVAFDKCLPDRLKGLDIHTSWMQSAPGIAKYYRLYFLLYPFAVGSLNLSPYDLVVSSSSGYAKGIHTDRDSIHVCYCHTPMRWVWDLDKYSSRESMNGLMKSVLPKLISGLRTWDVGAARQPDHFIANSRTVAARIKALYQRHAEIINPPIDLHRFHSSSDQDDYYLVLSRLVSYKRLDLAVRACTLLKKKLLVIGDGPHRQALADVAGPSVTFCGRLTDAMVDHYVSHCKALLFPGEEDFGMAPLEVAAAGRPCIAFRAGGATETIVEGVTGEFFDQQEVDALIAGIQHFERQSWSPDALRRHAEGFGVEVFREKMCAFLTRVGVPSRCLSAVTDQGGRTRTMQFPNSSRFYGWN